MKRRYLKWVLRILVGIFVVWGVGYGDYYFMAVVPARQLAALELSKQPVEPGELRRACHRAIAQPWWGGGHDAFLMLAGCGDSSSIPYLIRSLRWQSPPKDGFMDCQTAHCLRALYIITGQKFEYAPDRWEKWWKDNKATFHEDPEAVASHRGRL